MSKTVTKADIAKSICAQSEMKQQHAKKVLDAMLGIMKKALKEEKEMLLSGFGKFEAFTKKNRKGRNPQTGEEITLDSHDVLAFRISRKFKAAMNSEQLFQGSVEQFGGAGRNFLKKVSPAPSKPPPPSSKIFDFIRIPLGHASDCP